MKNFALIGASGYIAPRHLKAIKETGNNLVAAIDNTDSVGIMDSYFPEADFFTNFECFSSHLNDLVLSGKGLDYISICSPNYLHLPHIKFGLKQGIDVICEKPLVLNTADLAEIAKYEATYGAKVYSILQLRKHASIIELKNQVTQAPTDKIFDVDLTYLTARGKWYDVSWKGNDDLSGGVTTNIGVHLFDMLHFVFGEVISNELHYKDEKSAAGYLVYERARVRWFLSIDKKFLPSNAVQGEKLTYRSIQIEGKELEFSSGFTDLHTVSYENILNGDGYGVELNRPSISVVEHIRHSEPAAIWNFPCHPLIPKT